MIRIIFIEQIVNTVLNMPEGTARADPDLNNKGALADASADFHPNGDPVGSYPRG